MPLEQYQQDLKNGIYRAWHDGARNVCATMATGLGKSYTVGHIVLELNAPTNVIAHRTELVGQLSQALAERGVRHALTLPSASIRRIAGEHIRLLGRSYYDDRSPVRVLSAQSAIDLPDNRAPWLASARYWITDECFVAGTMVSTPNGAVPIETIRSGATVTAFDPETKRPKDRRVLDVFVSEAPALLVSVTIGGVETVCTPGHPFLTTRGWVDAGDLKWKDQVVRPTGERVTVGNYVLHRGRGEHQRVYNLHVEGLNTYVANGVVVHNCHHILKKNLWGRLVERMPNAFGLGVTATPIRAEGAGLGSHADGVFDALVEGPQLGEGIELGFLTPYQLVCAESDIEIDSVPISDATGDFNQVKLREAVHQSNTLVGDIVKTYKKFANGKAAIAFVIDIEEAARVATAFKAAGVAAEAISSKTPPDLRNSIMADFRAKRLQVLVNVDLFGEGVDIPALEVVIMARHTASLSLFLQQVGRALRLNVSKTLRAAWSTYTPEQRRQFIAESEKPFALVIDLVGNVVRHRFPCAVRQWTLDRRERRSRSTPADAVPLTVCRNEGCFQPYERHLTECPHCGLAPPVVDVPERGPKHVDGDMVLVDPRLMRVLESEVRRVDGDAQVPAGATPPVAGAIRRNHHERQLAQRDLRESIALWAGYYAHAGEPDRVIHKRFFITFGQPILEAMALGATEAGVLRGKIETVREGLK